MTMKSAFDVKSISCTSRKAELAIEKVETSLEKSRKQSIQYL
jgi:hypothetical protein